MVLVVRGSVTLIVTFRAREQHSLDVHSQIVLLFNVRAEIRFATTCEVAHLTVMVQPACETTVRIVVPPDVLIHSCSVTGGVGTALVVMNTFKMSIFFEWELELFVGTVIAAVG